MRANQTFILSLIFLALVGTFVVALIIKFSGPQEVIREVSTTSPEPEFIAVLNKVENGIPNTSEIALSTLAEHSHEEEEEIDVVKVSPACSLELVMSHFKKCKFDLGNRCARTPALVGFGYQSGVSNATHF